MPIPDTDSKINLGHERKRKRMEDKIPKSGGKRPRRCDKENKHSSPYFGSNQTTSTDNKSVVVNPSSSITSLPVNTFSINSPLQDTTNIRAATSTLNGSMPTLIKSVRFWAGDGVVALCI